MKQLVWTFCMLYAGIAHGQNSLKIGNRLPDLPLAKVLYKDNIVSVNTRDYKDKLLIINFFHTASPYSIESLPKLDELQKTFADKIKIITSTDQKEDFIRMFKSRNKVVKEFSLPILVEDSLLQSYFPYKGVSHVVWINKGIVIGITGGEYVHPDMITKILNGEKAHLPLKYDFYTHDFKNTSILGKINANKLKSYSAISGYIDKAPSLDMDHATVIDSIHATIKEVVFNRGIMSFYIGLAVKLLPKGFIRDRNMNIIEADQPEHYQFNGKNYNEFEQDWLEKNAISYEATFPLNTDEKTRAKLIIEDLNSKLGLNFRMEKRLVKTLVISSLKEQKSIDNLGKDATNYTNQSLQYFILTLRLNTFLSSNFSDLPPIIDEINLPDKIIKAYAYEDFAGLKKSLNLNGLDISEQERMTNMFVLTDKRNQ